MELGFETIGNATLICHDGHPVLVTDPWVTGGAYFGSWALSHEVPPQQLESIKACDYVWLSHGHPDHLSGDSLALLRGKKILVPNHFGNRIYDDLKAQGYEVHLLLDRVWKQLSPNIRILCIPDYNQDAVLLVDVGGKLVVNLNDASDRGWGRFVRKVISGYPVSFLLALSGYGDADMINFFDEEGHPIPPQAAQRVPPGQTIARQAEHYGVRYFVPFSSMHKYQRKDSAWASQYTTHLDDYAKGFQSTTCELTPAFIRYDALRDTFEELHPPERSLAPLDPQEFGDDWSERLETAETQKLTSYFRSIQVLHEKLDFINFRVGGVDNHITFNAGRTKRGITFEAPRGSLMTAVEYQVFDDLLIGNFMRTTLHGDWGPLKLYPDFTPYVAKYADNGRVKTRNELAAYFGAYRARDPLGFLRHQFEQNVVRPAQETTANFLRTRIGPSSPLYKASKRVYWGVKRAFL